VVLATVLKYYPPQEYAFYPNCPIYQWLGVQCPGCGITRAFVELMSGHFQKAAQLNVLVFLALPAAAAFACLQGYYVLRWNRWLPMRFPPSWIVAANATVLIFGLARALGSAIWTGR
jgi:hypothetical protein